MSGKLIDFGSRKPILPHESRQEPPNEPPDGGNDLEKRVTTLEVEQRHLASKADIEGLKSWLSDKLEAQQRWFTERLDGAQWRMLGFLVTAIGLLLAGFTLILRVLNIGGSPSGS